MNATILHANLKEIGCCLLVVKIKYQKLIVLSEMRNYPRPPYYVSLGALSQIPSWKLKGVSFSALYGSPKRHADFTLCTHIKKKRKCLSISMMAFGIGHLD